MWRMPLEQAPTEMTEQELLRSYEYPTFLEEPYVRVNFVCSANGITTVGGVSAGLASREDTRLFVGLRELADVILVGAGTARIERYRGARSPQAARRRRLDRGQAETAPIAVVTAGAQLDPAGPLFTDTFVPPILLTTESAPRERLSRLAEAGAEIFVVGKRYADIGSIRETLNDLGLKRVLCEGGPQLFGQLVGADVVDELCLTVASSLVGGTDSISVGETTKVRPMSLVSAIASTNALMLRYRRDR